MVFLLSLVLMATAARADILIGVAGPLSGQFGILGNQLKSGVETAVADFNASGGINGELLNVLAIDDACDTRRAVEAAKEFVSRDVRVVIGHYCSGTSMAAALVYKDASIPMISPSATAPQLTDARNWNVFRLAGRDDALAGLLSERLKRTQSKAQAVFVGDGQPASAVLAEALKAKIPSIEAFAYKSGSTNTTRLVEQILQINPGIVILGLPGAEAVQVTKILSTANFKGDVMSGEALLSDDFTNRAGKVDFNIFTVIPSDPPQNQLAGALVSRLTLAGQEADGAVLPAYAATQIFVAAAKATSVNDGKALANWLRIGSATETVLGNLKFDSKGDLVDPQYSWYIWDGATSRFLPE